MNLKEAVCAMLGGKKMRLPNWEDGNYIYFGCNVPMYGTFMKKDYTPIQFTREEELCDDWEEHVITLTHVSFSAALSAMKRGKHVKRAHWDKKLWWIDKNHDLRDGGDFVLFEGTEMLFADDWQILPEKTEVPILCTAWDAFIAKNRSVGK